MKRTTFLVHRACCRARDLAYAVIRPFARRDYIASPDKRSKYWEKRALDIHRQWGTETADFPAIRGIVDDLKPRRILDIGCGSGRLFQLYDDCGVTEIFGQDISEKALELCRQRYPRLVLNLCSLSICDLRFPPDYFDLIVSNRVLQHVPPPDLPAVLRHLSCLGKAVYLNEMSDSDHNPKFHFMFKHQYAPLLAAHGFRQATSGFVGSQHWFLFRKPEH